MRSPELCSRRSEHIIGCSPNLAIDAGLGWAGGDRAMYNAHARFGTSVTMYLGDCRDGCRGQRLGWLAGIGVDAVGDRIPRAWTVPIDVLYFMKPSNDTQVGLLGGPRFGLSADRGIGWAANLQLVWREAFDGDERKPYLPRDVNLELGVTSIADVVLVGVSLGIRIRARRIPRSGLVIDFSSLAGRPAPFPAMCGNSIALFSAAPTVGAQKSGKARPTGDRPGQ